MDDERPVGATAPPPGPDAVEAASAPVADFAADTAVAPAPGGEPGRYVAEIRPAWEIWGPCGGYVAAIALRAAGAASRFDRPASFACHYLGVARFAEVGIDVTVVRAGRTTESLLVHMTQNDRPILVATVLTVSALEGLAHDVTVMPDVPPPGELVSMADRLADLDLPPDYPFWTNIDSRIIDWHEVWPPSGPLAPTWRQWQRILPDGTFDDPWVDAARSVLWVDIGGWPATNGHHAWASPDMVAVNVDLYVAFHQPRPSSAFLLLDSHAPVATDGLVGYHARTWSEDGALVASGGGQLLCRPIPRVPNAAEQRAREAENEQ